MAWTETPAYQADLRVRATTCRLAANIEPPHMRSSTVAIERCGDVADVVWLRMM